MKNKFYIKNKLTPIINVSGFMTKIGASITRDYNIKAAKEILPNFVNLDELQTLASKKISKMLKTEAAVITASAAAGLTESIAAAMTGNDLKKIYDLPNTKIKRHKKKVPITGGIILFINIFVYLFYQLFFFLKNSLFIQ